MKIYSGDGPLVKQGGRGSSSSSEIFMPPDLH